MGVAQRNAIESWARLEPQPRIVLFGDDSGTAEAAEEFGAIHLSALAESPSGAPMLDGLFATVQRHYLDDLLCYVNADIVLIGDLVRVACAVAAAFSRFVLVARRIDLDIGGPIDFESVELDWRRAVLARAEESGIRSVGAAGSDLFAFSPRVFDAVPPLAIGRCFWDNWLMAEPLRRHVPLIDATECLTLLHQPHGYDHIGVSGRGLPALRTLARMPEARRNLTLAGGAASLRMVSDATYWVHSTPQGIQVLPTARTLRWKSTATRVKFLLKYYLSELMRYDRHAGSRTRT